MAAHESTHKAQAPSADAVDDGMQWLLRGALAPWVKAHDDAVNCDCGSLEVYQTCVQGEAPLDWF